MKTNIYQHLKGKQLKFYRDSEEEYFDVFVADIDPEIGITIKYLEPGMSVRNDKNNAVCVNKAQHPRQFEEWFTRSLQEIEDGIIPYNPLKGSSMPSCPFM